MEESRPKIGLALGSGGARGFAHIGVIKALEKEKIPIDLLAGSSMGSLVASLYGIGQSTESMERLATMFRRKYYMDFTVPKLGFVNGNRIKELIRLLAKSKNLEDTQVPVSVIATDLKKGERVIMTEGPIAEAVRASIGIPGIFVPEKRDGKVLVDGGVIDRVPVSVVKGMGSDITIAVDVSYFRQELDFNSVYDVIMQSMDIMAREMMKPVELDCSVIIRPIVKHTSSLDFSNVERLIERGEEATYEQMPKIKQIINDWKGQDDESKKPE
ncbi:patatin-like phospholipase family protein [Alkalihalophilus lindianensis]|uniref:Patatin-like phospholipase family protein n=1 Tax=Alkalihalophilus lindianensis TaxID=1630542 RepID=A0ABU3XBP4_9BACI|nr:patatin-like phospholipase family protein [Alkalihalophilus lindianensis]MDV2685315.1 patatin-like phospholipase family protein [Alkalihalophilus lindianensis]